MTVAGSGEMLAQSKETAAILREHVTSPGGTTEAALTVLMADAGFTDACERSGGGGL